MTVSSAKNGTGFWDSQTLTDVRNIDVTKIAEEKVYGSSSTACKRKRIKGFEDENGTFEVYADSQGNLPFVKGDIGYLDLRSTATEPMFAGNALISEIAWSVPVEEGDPVSATVTFGQS